MNETTTAFKAFAATPVGLTVLIGVGLIVLVAGGIPLWRSMKYLFKATLWGLLVALVLALAAGAIWLWMESKATDPGQKEALKREAAAALRNGLGKTPDEADVQAGAGELNHAP